MVVVGYPQIVPATGTCPRCCRWPPATTPTRGPVNEGLADAVRSGAAEAADAYVDVFAASAGHDICADDPWINGRHTDPTRALAFHPFADGAEGRRRAGPAGPDADPALVEVEDVNA